MQINQGRNYPWTRGAMPPLILKKKYYYIYMCVLILAILFYKITFYFPLKISLILLRLMLYSQTFLQIILVSNSYWFAYGPNTHIIFLLSNNRTSHQQFVNDFGIFLILKTIKKFIDLKSKTKYTSPKKKCLINQFYPK